MYILLVPSTKVTARDKEVNDIGSPADIMNAYGRGSGEYAGRLENCYNCEP